MHIFISYAKIDTRTLALNLSADIGLLENVTVWMDDSLETGADWARQIEREIDKCDLMIVLLSPDVNRETIPISFVLNEINYAQSANKPILPVMVQQTRVPIRIAGIQYIDLTHNREVRLSELIRDVSQRANTNSPNQVQRRVMQNQIGLTSAQSINIGGTEYRDPNPSSQHYLLYVAVNGKTILMVQTYVDRAEWGDNPYHIKSTRQPLRKVLKVYANEKHPVSPQKKDRYISNAVENILNIAPDIIGMGGMGNTMREIRKELKTRGNQSEIGYWGSDVGSDAKDFLERYNVSPPY